MSQQNIYVVECDYRVPGDPFNCIEQAYMSSPNLPARWTTKNGKDFCPKHSQQPTD